MKIELITTEDRGRYLVSHAAEIVRILRELMEDKNIVALYGENEKQFLLSTLVAIEPEKGYLLFEQGVDQAMNALLLNSKECTFASTHDQVHIQFSSSMIEADKLGHEAVFRVPMPREILRLQRREYYRLVTSVINPVKCQINTSTVMMESVVVDISIGGVGVLAAGARGARRVDPDVLGLDLDVDLLGLGQDGHGRRRGVDAPARLGRRHPLHAVHARFIFELRVRALAANFKDHFLITTHANGTL